MHANGWKNMLWDHWCGMVTNRRVGKNQYTPQVLGPEYEPLTWTQINVTQCGGETETSRSLAGCTLLLNDAALLIPPGAKRLWAETYQACPRQKHRALQCRVAAEGNKELNSVFLLGLCKGEQVLPNHLCRCSCTGPISKGSVVFGSCFLGLLLHCRKMENGWNRM